MALTFDPKRGLNGSGRRERALELPHRPSTAAVAKSGRQAPAMAATAGEADLSPPLASACAAAEC
jgi:hypothetical protein